MMMILISLYPILYPILIRYCLLGTKPTLCKLLLACEMPHPYGYQLMMMYANVLLNDQTSDRCRNWITKMYIRLKVMSLWVECFCITKIYKEIKKTAMSEFAVIICFSLFLSFTEKKASSEDICKEETIERRKKKRWNLNTDICMLSILTFDEKTQKRSCGRLHDVPHLVRTETWSLHSLNFNWYSISVHENHVV